MVDRVRCAGSRDGVRRETGRKMVAQGAEMVVAHIPEKCCRFVAVCSRWRSAREDGGVLRVKWLNAHGKKKMASR